MNTEVKTQVYEIKTGSGQWEKVRTTSMKALNDWSKENGIKDWRSVGMMSRTEILESRSLRVVGTDLEKIEIRVCYFHDSYPYRDFKVYNINPASIVDLQNVVRGSLRADMLNSAFKSGFWASFSIFNGERWEETPELFAQRVSI